MVGEFKTVRKGHEMTNRKMFFTMLWGAVFRRRSRAVMAVIASMVGAATLFCLAATCIAVPQQMNEEMRAYGANLIVTPSESTEKSNGIDTDTTKALNQMVKGSYSARSAAYRYESVRINSAPYTLAGITTKDVKALNHHWNVTGDWPSEGNVMLGRDVADALGVSIGSTVTIGYRASDDAQNSGAPGQTEAQAMENGRVSSDIMENTGTEFRVGGIVDTGGSEDEIVYAVNADVAKLAGSKRGADVIEYSVNAVGSELNDVVKSINANPSTGVKAQTVTKITSSDTRIIAMLQTLFWIVSLVVLVLTLVGVGIVAGHRHRILCGIRHLRTDWRPGRHCHRLPAGPRAVRVRIRACHWLQLAVGRRFAAVERAHRRHRIHSAGSPRNPYRPRHRFEGGIIMSSENTLNMLLELDHISKIYGDLRAVDDLTLTVPQGEWLAIVGSSGSGKTTLMNMIGCMDTPSKGSVMLEGRKLEDLNAKQLADVRKNMIGLVFQKFYLVPHLTAVENVMVAQYYHSVVNEQQALEALERVGLKERAHHLPGQLSGGEQQRVCIARALINCPKLILADEPTGNLDEKNEKIVLDLFRQLHEQGTTIIVVTHDALVASCAQREIMLNHGVLVGEKWNDEAARKAYEQAGGKPAYTGSTTEGAQNGETAISFADPTKAAKTGGEE